MNVIVFDNLSNSSPKSLERVQKITGKTVEFIQGDITEPREIAQVFEHYNIKAVMHFAGLKSTYESISLPIHYYKTNVVGTMNLLEAMKAKNCNNIVFSSSATVYGAPKQDLVSEEHSLDPLNPYGRSKLYAEYVIRDFCIANPQIKACLLRYFNPAGNHESGLLGEDPNGIPNNLMPYLLKVLGGHLPHVNVFGNDYETKDGTGVRDFIHVVDLAKGHVAAIEKLLKSDHGCFTYNMGTGSGYSVFDMIGNLEKVAEKVLPFKIAPRREGDAASVVANPSLANKELGWSTKYDLHKMCKDAWKWQSENPNGFASE